MTSISVALSFRPPIVAEKASMSSVEQGEFDGPPSPIIAWTAKEIFRDLLHTCRYSETKHPLPPLLERRNGLGEHAVIRHIPLFVENGPGNGYGDRQLILI